jgi:hypothetical protein
MIDALIKCVSVTYKCYEMYPVSASGKKGTTARVLRSIKKWTPTAYRTTFRLLRTKITIDLLFPCKQII